jgi:ribonucleoside-diphosphate reductase beta chain
MSKEDYMARTVFSTKHRDHTTSKMFLDPAGGVNLQRYDTLKYKQFDKLTDKQLGFFWRPEEVDITKDSKDFKDLTVHEQHIFTSNLKRQILLDSVQGRSPNIAFLPIVGIPELETWIETWAFSETIHSRSYTHIIRNVYSDPSKVFDEMLDIDEIASCSDSISKYYDELIRYNDNPNLFGTYEHKKVLYKAIMAVNILEGVRFYVSFACSWAFAELKKMEGNAKIIKLIARDENVHLASTQQILKLLPTDDKDFVKIRKECEGESTEMFMDAIRQEKDWAEYLFKDGSMIGLNAELLKQ